MREYIYLQSGALTDTQLISRDPQCLRTDAELIAILQRASLLPASGPIDAVVEAKFSLDSAVTDEGTHSMICQCPHSKMLHRFQL